MSTRSAFVQIRVTPAEKTTLKRLAQSSGQDLSKYVLSMALPATRLRFEGILGSLREETDHRFALAELNDLLSDLAPMEFHRTVHTADLAGLSPFLQNYVAAIVEHAAGLKKVDPPSWTRSVRPLPLPWFATPLRGLRLHLLRASPVPFKRRNLFVDASVGARV
jgi:hypothetical protein